MTPPPNEPTGDLTMQRVQKPTIPGLLITATDTGVGKTLVTAALGRWFASRGRRVAVMKPAATGCSRGREGLISDDAEFIAHHANTPFPLDLVCPQRFVEPLAPAVAAQREKRPVDFEAIDNAVRLMSASADVVVVEGVGGIMVPIDVGYTVLDLAVDLDLPAVVVARPSLGTINHTVLTLMALRGAGVRVAGVVVNRYPVDQAGIAEETNVAALEKYGKTSVLTVVPDEPYDASATVLPPGIMSAIERVDWGSLAQRPRRPNR